MVELRQVLSNLHLGRSASVIAIAKPRRSYITKGLTKLAMEVQMKTSTTLVSMASLMAVSALADPVNFDDLKAGAPAPGWTAAQTGTGDAKWEVVADGSAPSKPNVLKQSGEATYQMRRGQQCRHNT